MSELTVFFIVIGLWITAVIGWILNILNILDTLGGEVTALFIARLVGVPVAPLGSLLGLFT